MPPRPPKPCNSPPGARCAGAGDLPIANYDELSVPDAAEAVRGLESPEQLQAVLRYEEDHKNRSGVLTVTRSRHAEVARAAVS